KVAFAFDIDGVLKQGEHVLPQARRILKLLSGQNDTLPKPVPFLLLTNGGGMTEAERCKALSEELEVPLGPNQLVQSHTPLRDYVMDYADKPVLVVGGQGDAGRRIAESYGLKRAYLMQDILAWRSSVWDRYVLSAEEEAFARTDIDFASTPLHAIFVIHDRGLDWGMATQIITELLASDGGLLGTRRKRRFGEEATGEVPLVLTNPDFVWGTDYPLPRFGMGAFRLALAAVYNELTGLDLTYTQYGKPYHETYAFAEKMLRQHIKGMGRDPSERLNVYMIGDNPESDIAGANSYGWSSILVETGVFKKEEGPPVHTPSRVVKDVEEGVMWALEQEGW
ncbi:hypothetical protein TREMEDRAFT_33906, partial [Tremella mesenterica DSM 1558]